MNDVYLHSLLGTPSKASPQMKESIESLVSKHPYSYLANLFMAKLALDNNLPDKNRLIQHAAFYSNNKKLMHSYLGTEIVDKRASSLLASFSPLLAPQKSKNQNIDSPTITASGLIDTRKPKDSASQAVNPSSLPIYKSTQNLDEILNLIEITRRSRLQFHEEMATKQWPLTESLPTVEKKPIPSANVALPSEASSSLSDDFLGFVEIPNTSSHRFETFKQPIQQEESIKFPVFSAEEDLLDLFPKKTSSISNEELESMSNAMHQQSIDHKLELDMLVSSIMNENQSLTKPDTTAENKALTPVQVELELDFLDNEPKADIPSETVDLFATAIEDIPTDGIEAQFHERETWFPIAPETTIEHKKTVENPSFVNNLHPFSIKSISESQAYEELDDQLKFTKGGSINIDDNQPMFSSADQQKSVNFEKTSETKSSTFQHNVIPSTIQSSHHIFLPKTIIKPQNLIIDAFLENNPAMPHLNPFDNEPIEQEDLSAKSTIMEENLATESLALIYARQGKSQKAIETYVKLMLKHPEKTAYFAIQIETLAKALASK